MQIKPPSYKSNLLCDPVLYGIEERLSDAITNATQNTLESLWLDDNPAYEAFRCVTNSIVTLDKLANFVRDLPYQRLVIIGMGASVLNPQTILSAATDEHKTVVCLVSLDDRELNEALRGANPEQCGFLVISKSGSTLETIALTLAARQWIIANGLAVAKHLVLLTGEVDSQLERLAQHDTLAYRYIHPNIEGRFASFTSVTLIPGIFAGIDMQSFLAGALLCLKEAQEQGAISSVGCAVRFHMLTHNTGRKLHFLETYNKLLIPFSRWWCQLWAESLGKNSEAIMPIRSSGSFDHHSQWQLYLASPQNKCMTLVAPLVSHKEVALAEADIADVIGIPNFARCGMKFVLDATFYGAKAALEQHNVPCAIWTLNTEDLIIHDIGYLMMHTMLTIFTIGRLSKVNPFGQPEVESLKVAAKEFINNHITNVCA